MRFSAFVLSAAILLSAYTHNAITGRNQLSLVSESQVKATAKTQYAQFLTQNKVVSEGTSREAEMVRRVGSRIAAAITKYYTEKGQSNRLMRTELKS